MDGKEHPGGAHPEGFTKTPVEWTDGVGRDVAVETFDPTTLDTLTDLCREALLDGAPVEPILQAHFAAVLEESRREHLAEGIQIALAEILGSKNVQKTAAALSFASGLDLTLGQSGPALAEKYGVSKEAFFQEVARIEARFGGRLKRLNQRDAEARREMSAAAYRKTKLT